MKQLSLLLVLGAAACNAGRPAPPSGPDALRRVLASPLLAPLPDPAPRPASDAESALPARPAWPRLAGDEPVTLNFRRTPLPEAIQLIAESAGVNVYVDATLAGVVDATFPSVRLDDALRAILERNGLALVEDPPGIFWVQTADGSEVRTARFFLRSIHATDVAEKVTALASSGSRVVVDENQNLVVVRGPRADLDLIADYLSAADRLKPQVLIEVSLFEVGVDDEFTFGVSHEIRGTIDGDQFQILQTLLTANDDFQATYETSDGDISSLVELLQQYVSLELISTPRVMAVTNTEALIEIVEEVPYVNVTSTNDAGGGSSVVQEVVFKDAGVRLRVLPTVQEGGVLQVLVDQELSEVVDFFQGVPVIDSRHLTSKFLVADRQTIVLGGLIQDQRASTDRGVPLLMRLPLIGRLFRSERDTTEKRELLIFLTPRILDPEQAARLAPAFQDEYREIRRANDLPDGPAGTR